MPSPVTYQFKIDPKMWAAFRARVNAEGRTIIWTIRALIQQYTEHGLKTSRKKDV